ncbi:MAG: FtsK/SpoIIIE domain-containing protein [Bacillota bacterium]|nr:FtsK/SpoIIIE domain-containing protein [Bacillota bacterium]
MITEMALMGFGCYAYNKYKNRETIKIKKTFNDLMQDNNLSYKIIDITKNDSGFTLVVSLYGCGYEKLESLKDLLQSTFGALIEIKQNPNLKTATLEIITTQLSDNYKFKPIPVRPWELYVGKTYTMKDVILNMKDLPHVLYSGINSSGKTYCVFTAILNLIQYNSERDVEVFLSQVSAKKDLRKFKDLQHCRGYADNLKEAYQMFQYLYHVMLKRINMFNSIKERFVDDIYEWNANYPQKKMRIIYLIMDEFTAYMPDSLDTEEEKEIKQRCLDLLVKLIQQSRCCGMYMVTSLQRPDRESLPARLKAQFNCKISFKQPNIASSLTVTDSDAAFHIKAKREAIVNADKEYLIKTLYLDNKMLQTYLLKNIDKSHSNYCKIKDANNLNPKTQNQYNVADTDNLNLKNNLSSLNNSNLLESDNLTGVNIKKSDGNNFVLLDTNNLNQAKYKKTKSKVKLKK